MVNRHKIARVDSLVLAHRRLDPVALAAALAALEDGDSSPRAVPTSTGVDSSAGFLEAQERPRDSCQLAPNLE